MTLGSETLEGNVTDVAPVRMHSRDHRLTSLDNWLPAFDSSPSTNHVR